MNTSVCRDRAPRRGWKPFAAGAAVVAALLTSTACGPGDADATLPGTSSAPPSATEPSDSAAPTTTPTDAPTGTASSKPSATSSKPGGSGGGTAVGACTAEDLSVSAVEEPTDKDENRHFVLTVQNAGDDTCDLYNYPHVMLGDAAAPTPVIKESNADPGVPVTLEPGKEAYAALLVSGGARDEYEAKHLTLTLQGRKPGSRAGGPIDVPMPVSTLYADDGQLVTYWTTASGFALDFIMSK
ncbi:DUF4232 domain-containing protein [Streptomyces sp. NPDC002057]|uniref:DUF4232 domain-containing protein n=1 Tax=Streptomyces sp. NPDC002057 TaxID=3154664 RepID=UPI00332EBE68